MDHHCLDEFVFSAANNSFYFDSSGIFFRFLIANILIAIVIGSL